MNKIELINKIADKADSSKLETEKFVNAFIETIINELKDDNKVAIAGFGSFEKVIRAARTGINPSTKEKIQIPEKAAPKFKAAKSFKEILN